MMPAAMINARTDPPTAVEVQNTLFHRGER
jgi:hypothetical protein